MQLIKAFLSLMLGLTATGISAQNADQPTVLFCYGDFYPEKVSGYDFVIIEPSLFSQADIHTLKSQNKNVLAYLSVGEVNEDSPESDRVKDESIGYNKIWDSYIIDIEAAETKKLLNERVDRFLKDKNFDGLFLDNVDNYTKWGPSPEKKDALLSFLKQVQKKYCSAVIMQNAALLIVNDTAPYIQAIGIESVVTDYDFKRNRYRLRKTAEKEEILREIQEIEANHDVPIILIEYAIADPLKSEVVRILKDLGRPYFLGNIDLQSLPE